MDKMKCPYCDYEIDNSWEYFGEDFEADGDTENFNCQDCGKDFKCNLSITYGYDCEKIESEG